MSRLSLPAPRPGAAVLLLTALSLPLVFWGLGRYGIVGADEAFYQSIAVRMLESGNWLRVQSGANVHIYDTFANAPLQYWARGLVVSLLGDTLLAARLVSSLSAWLAVLATYGLVLHVAGRRAALLAGLVLLTTFQFLYLHSARTGELEPIVCLLLVGLAHLFLRAIEDPRRSLLAHHVLLALLFNVKAPTIAIPLAAELVCFALIPRARSRGVEWLRLGLVVLPFALVWHVGQAIAHRGALLAVIQAVQHQAAGEYATGPTGGLGGRLLYYGPRLLFGTFPHALLFPLAALAVARDALGGGGDAPRRRDASRLLLIYPLVTGLFYLGISKVGPWYPVHAYPFLAAWLGLWLADLEGRRVGLVLLALLALALSLAFWLLPEMAAYNPFSDDAIRIPMRTGWRSLGALGPALGVPLFAVAIGLALVRARPRGAVLAPALALVFVGYALVRALLPLRYVDHLSEVAALHVDLDERSRAGQPIPYPVEVPRAHPWVVNYYFWGDYDVVAAPGGNDPNDPSAARFLLFEKGSRRRPRAGNR